MQRKKHTNCFAQENTHTFFNCSSWEMFTGFCFQTKEKKEYRQSTHYQIDQVFPNVLILFFAKIFALLE